MTTSSAARKQAHALVLANLSTLAADLIHWRSKGKLPEQSLMFEVASLLEPECLADDSMQQAEYLVMSASLEQTAAVSDPVISASSLVPRLDWASRMLRATANRGRAQLGDGYTEVLQVLGAVNASLEVLGAPVPESNKD